MRINSNVKPRFAAVKTWKSKLVRAVGKKFAFLLAIVGASVAGGATTAVVMAAIPDGNGTIHACYTTGLLAKVRIIDSPSQSCNGLETPISWSQTGPAGPAGPQGPAGPSGSGNLKYAESSEEFSLTPAESEAQNNSADLGGPEITVSVPNTPGNLVKFFGSIEIKGNCEIYPVAFLFDESTDQVVGGTIDSPLIQFFAGGPIENYQLHSLGTIYASSVSPGEHTYSLRYKNTAYDNNASCAGFFKNGKLWAEVVTPSS